MIKKISIFFPFLLLVSACRFESDNAFKEEQAFRELSPFSHQIGQLYEKYISAKDIALDEVYQDARTMVMIYERFCEKRDVIKNDFHFLRCTSSHFEWIFERMRGLHDELKPIFYEYLLAQDTAFDENSKNIAIVEYASRDSWVGGMQLDKKPIQVCQEIDKLSGQVKAPARLLPMNDLIAELYQRYDSKIEYPHVKELIDIEKMVFASKVYAKNQSLMATYPEIFAPVMAQWKSICACLIDCDIANIPTNYNPITVAAYPVREGVKHQQILKKYLEDDNGFAHQY